MAYSRKDTSLAAVFEQKEIVSRDARLTEVFITSVAGVFGLRFGATGDIIDITGPISFKPQGQEQRNGLYMVNAAAQAGVVQTVYVGFSGGLDIELEKA